MYNNKQYKGKLIMKIINKRKTKHADLQYTAPCIEDRATNPYPHASLFSNCILESKLAVSCSGPILFIISLIT